MSYTADPRVLFAAERTLLAWQRSAIALMGIRLRRRTLRLVSANGRTPARRRARSAASRWDWAYFCWCSERWWHWFRRANFASSPRIWTQQWCRPDIGHRLAWP